MGYDADIIEKIQGSLGKRERMGTQMPGFPGPPEEQGAGGARIPWKMIVAAVVVIAIIVTGISLYFAFKTPGMKVSPPPGWVEVSAEEKDAKERELREDSPHRDLIALYQLESSSLDRIAITRNKAAEDGELPETSDIAVVEEYIEEMEQSLGPEEMEYVGDVDAVMLGCGLAGLYQATEGGDWNYEALSVRKKDKVFVILFFNKKPMLQIPSPEMQYFMDSISFN